MTTLISEIAAPQPTPSLNCIHLLLLLYDIEDLMVEKCPAIESMDILKTSQIISCHMLQRLAHDFLVVQSRCILPRKQLHMLIHMQVEANAVFFDVEHVEVSFTSYGRRTTARELVLRSLTCILCTHVASLIPDLLQSCSARVK